MKSFSIQKLNGLLKTNVIGKIIHYHEEISSTNTALFELARNGASEGTVVIADKQTSGKGRLDRKWISPPGANLYISILLRPKLRAHEAQFITFLASIALIETINKTGIDDASIKWPNDIYIEDKKTAGVLTEIDTNEEKTEFIVLGIGVNMNMSRELMDKELGVISQRSTSLKERLDREIDRAKFSSDLLLELELWYGLLNKHGQSFILQKWAERWGGKNRRVRVNLDKENTFEGQAMGLDERGFLKVKKDDQEIVKVITGDVILI